MPEAPTHPQRRHLRRLERVFAHHPVFLVTVCTLDRQRVLTLPGFPGELAAAFRQSAYNAGWAVGHYVVMPDHIHFFCSPGAEAHVLPRFVGRWKSWTSRQARHLGTAQRLWQREFLDHVIRSQDR